MAIAVNTEMNGTPQTEPNSIATGQVATMPTNAQAPSSATATQTPSAGTSTPYPNVLASPSAASATAPAGSPGNSIATPATNPNAWGTANVATVGNAPTPSEYMSTLQAAYAPAFQQSQEALNANQAALGTLYSGAGNYGQQELQAQDAATLAQGELPLIQQGYGQDFSAAQQNASAANSMLGQIQGESSTQALQNQQLQNTDSLYNAGQYNNVLGTNTADTNNYLNSQSGYANSDYGTTLQDLYGLLSGQQSAQAGIYGSGANNEVQGYQYGQTAGTQNANNSDSALGSLGGDLFENALLTGAV